MKIFSPHRRRIEAKRRFGGKEFQNKIKKAQNYKRVFDPRTKNAIFSFFKIIGLGTWWAKGLALIALVVPAYFLFISDYFVVRSVSGFGGTEVSNQQIQELFNERTGSVNFFIPKNHFIFLTKGQVQKILTEEFPLIKNVTEYKFDWPNHIEIMVEERQPGFVFETMGQQYLVDDQGLVVKPVEEVNNLITVINQVEETVEEGEQLNNSKLIGFILSMVKQWPSKINSQIKEARVPGKAAGQIQFVSNEGWAVFFDINYPVEAQLTNLVLILNRQIPAKDRLNLAYIDLRFDKWAYYCYKNEPCVSQPTPSPVETESSDPDPNSSNSGPAPSVNPGASGL